MSTFYILRNLRNSRILKLMVTMTRSKLKSKLQFDLSHLQPLRNVPTKHQPPNFFQRYCPDKLLKVKITTVKSKVKSRSHHDIICTPTTPTQFPYQVLTSYSLQFPRYSPDKILKVKVTTVMSKVNSRSHHDDAHLQPPTNVLTKYQLPTR